MNRRVNSPPRILIDAVAAGLLIIAGLIDSRLLGTAVHRDLFYLAPVAVAAWYAGRSSGVLFAVLSVVVGTVVHVSANGLPTYDAVPYLNAGMRLILYLSAVFALSALRRSRRREESMSRVDYLTGALNGRSFIEVVSGEMARTQRYKSPVSLVYLDLDNFKNINDAFGYQTGDLLLTLAAGTMKGCIRSVDIHARLGGDEFAVLMPNTGYAQAEVAVKRLRRTLLNAMKDNGWDITASIGVVTYTGTTHSANEFISLAENIMGMVKSHGKDGIKQQAL